LQLKTFS
jgi:hypothetical protein